MTHTDPVPLKQCLQSIGLNLQVGCGASPPSIQDPIGLPIFPYLRACVISNGATLPSSLSTPTEKSTSSTQ